MPSEKAGFLKEYDTYRELTDRDLEMLEILNEVTFKRGEMIFAEGNTSNAMYVIRKGIVKIFKKVQEDEQTIAVASQGEFFGEMALVDGSLRSASVRASADVIALRINKGHMDFLQRHRPAVALKLYKILLRTLSARLRRTLKKTAG